MKLNPFLVLVRKPLFLLVVYIILSIVLLRMNPEKSLQGLRYGALQVVEVFAKIRFQIAVWKDYQKEVEILKRENFKLQTTLQKTRDIFLENERLKLLLNFKEENQLELIPSKIIGVGTELGVRSFVLDIGEEDGAQKNMPVLTADGLVGKIVLTTPKQSICQILKDHNSLVSARLQNSREIGVVSWDGEPWLNLLYISKDVPVNIGEDVVTSGLSKIYPPFLRIGQVSEINENEYDLFKEIRIKPAVNFNSLEEVIVIHLIENDLTNQVELEE